MNLLQAFGCVVFSLSWLGVIPLFNRPDPTAAACGFVLGAIFLAVGSRDDGGPRARVAATARLLVSAASIQVLATLVLAPLAARYHRVEVLAEPAAALLKLIGRQAYADGALVHVQSAAHVLPFATTWEKLGLAPLVWIAAVVIPLLAPRRRFARSLASFGFVAVLYVPLRYVALIVLASEHADPLNLEIGRHSPVTEVFRAPLAQLASFLPLAILLPIALSPRVVGELAASGTATPPRRRLATALALFAVAAACATASLRYVDEGTHKAGRVVIDDHHSPTWEPARATFDTESFGRDSIYTYATFTAWLGRHYDVRVNVDDPCEAPLLDGCDVLIVKTPTVPFAEKELDAIEDFVERGGGLLLLGDHTNLLGSGGNLNALASRFGVRFNLDSANRLDDLRFHTYSPPPLLAHPAVQDVEELGFMTSCTLDASLEHDAIIACGNVFSDALDYSAESFFGNVVPDLAETFGPHVLAAGTRKGRGRVVAFSDATVFSNFAMMHGGRPELALGFVEYLNREGASRRLCPRLLMALAGLALLGAVCFGRGFGLVRLLAAAAPLPIVIGVAVGAGAATLWSRAAYASPTPRRPMVEIAFLREPGDYFLPPAVVETPENPMRCFDVFYVWTQRLGYFPRHLDLDRALEKEAMVVVNPCAPFESDDLDRVEEWVRNGGRLLVLDSIWNGASSSNQLLARFPGLKIGDSLVASSNALATRKYLDAANGRADDEVEGSECRAGEEGSGDDSRLVFGRLVARPLDGMMMTPSLLPFGGVSLFTDDKGRSLATMLDHGRGRVIVAVDSTTYSRAAMGKPSESISPDGPKSDLFRQVFSLFKDYLLSEVCDADSPPAHDCNEH